MDVTVSAVMANYNHACFLERALKHLLELSPFFCEILILDDCSTDRSWEILLEYSEKYPIIRLIRNEQNQGVCFSYNRLFREARGEYIVQQAADDYLLPEGMSELLRNVQAHPGAGYYCGNYFLYYPERDEKKRIPHFFKYGFTSPDQVTRVVHGQGLAQVGNCFLKKAALEFGGYRQEIRWNADWFMNNAIGLSYGIFFVPVETAVMVVDDRKSYGAQRLIWGKQKESLAAILRILQTEYPRTLFPLFIRCHILNTLGLSMIRYVLTTPGQWKPVMAYFLLSSAWQRFRHGVLPYWLPRPVKECYKSIRDKVIFRHVDEV